MQCRFHSFLPYNHVYWLVALAPALHAASMCTSRLSWSHLHATLQVLGRAVCLC